MTIDTLAILILGYILLFWCFPPSIADDINETHFEKIVVAHVVLLMIVAAIGVCYFGFTLIKMILLTIN